LGKDSIPVGNSNQIRIGHNDPSNLEAIFGYDPSVHGMSRELLNKIRNKESKNKLSSSSVNKAVARNLSARKYPTTALPTTFDGVRSLEDVRATGMFNDPKTSPSVRGWVERTTKKQFPEPNSFGRNSYFGRIPTFGKYAYSVDPALKRLIAQSSFGNHYGNSFGRINYGFSRYF